jgi:hypothetical protein
LHKAKRKQTRTETKQKLTAWSKASWELGSAGNGQCGDEEDD